MKQSRLKRAIVEWIQKPSLLELAFYRSSDGSSQRRYWRLWGFVNLGIIVTVVTLFFLFLRDVMVISFVFAALWVHMIAQTQKCRREFHSLATPRSWDHEHRYRQRRRACERGWGLVAIVITVILVVVLKLLIMEGVLES
jgi:uncharacterized membrane protein YidH (DUF202 family)